MPDPQPGPVPPQPPVEPERPVLGAEVGAGWREAVTGAVGTVVALGILGQALAFLLYAADDQNRPSLVNTARFGGLAFYAFHHVGLKFGNGAIGGLGGAGGSVTVALALLTGTLIAIWLLAMTGRAVAERAGGSSVARGLHGAKVAVPYALLCFGFAFIARVPPGEATAEFPASHPSYLGAVLWPLGIAAVAGFLGGLRSAAPSGVMATAWGARLRAAATGGTWMLAVGLVLAFVGLVLLTPTAPDVAANYFSPFEDNFARGTSVILGTVLALPNMAAWVLFPSMGSCLEASGSVFGFSGSFCFLSYSQFPTTRAISSGIPGPSLDLPSPAPGYFLFVLAPLIAVLVGGVIAARRVDAASKQEAAGVGALAGVAFAVLSLVVTVLSTVSARIGGLGQVPGSIHVRVGPALAGTFLVSLLWGVVGGVLGALWEARRLPLVPPAQLNLPSRDQAWAAGPR